MQKIPKRVSTALLNALSSGVVPRVGLDHIAVGREKEMAALSQDLGNVAEGGAAFRFVVGRYGSGKSFLLQLIRNQAMEQGFVVADADLSPERRLAGSKNQALATYRELMRNIATRTNPNGGAIALILEKWISTILNQVAQGTGKRPQDEGFDDQVELKIREVVNDLEGLVHGFDFANVIVAYWRGYREDDDDKKDAALRWLRGEFATKTEAKSALGVRVIIDDNTWYDYIKLFAKFVSDIGYKGLIILLDEAVHLYKITHAVSRQANYDKLLAMFNDAMQGKAEYLNIFVGGTPQFVEDTRRGLHADAAWRMRLAKSRFLKEGLADTSAPVIELEPLTGEELSHLLQRLAEVHAIHYKYKKAISARELDEFKQAVVNRLGADKLSTPREVVRDFISVLNILQQNPHVAFRELIQSSTFQASGADKNGDGDSEFAEFNL
ncbi:MULTISPECIES: ATP-binding protein [unclassified Coleofasciculus]|uniref:ATP-binding protein n=1 Tax=unclassified Coleofasciculus TaxID=2692782 RepID=UPI00187FD3BE|nr:MULTISPECIES: ATP-binding protein [unclassified Coleofasciculus]MBE9127392.1 ATP-binding protein [Coleofasciculus sp. LEGE 07081]MBE9147182.1 ATP-binding protein [Coleofasciculus sp. LEGE 07092]